MVTLEFLRHLPDTFFRELWFTGCSCGWRNGHSGISQALTGTTIAGSGGCVCSSVDTGWYSGSFESMVVSFAIADPNRE